MKVHHTGFYIAASIGGVKASNRHFFSKNSSHISNIDCVAFIEIVDQTAEGYDRAQE